MSACTVESEYRNEELASTSVVTQRRGMTELEKKVNAAVAMIDLLSERLAEIMDGDDSSPGWRAVAPGLWVLADDMKFQLREAWSSAWKDYTYLLRQAAIQELNAARSAAAAPERREA